MPSSFKYGAMRAASSNVKCAFNCSRYVDRGTRRICSPVVKPGFPADTSRFRLWYSQRQALIRAFHFLPGIARQALPPVFDADDMKERRLIGVQLRPTQRHGNRQTGAGARRERRHGSGIAIIAQIVEED